jgi:hypothetical protein
MFVDLEELDFVDLEENQMPYSVKAFSIYLAEHGKITGKRKMYLFASSGWYGWKR